MFSLAFLEEQIHCEGNVLIDTYSNTKKGAIDPDYNYNHRQAIDAYEIYERRRIPETLEKMYICTKSVHER